MEGGGVVRSSMCEEGMRGDLLLASCISAAGL